MISKFNLNTKNKKHQKLRSENIFDIHQIKYILKFLWFFYLFFLVVLSQNDNLYRKELVFKKEKCLQLSLLEQYLINQS